MMLGQSVSAAKRKSTPTVALTEIADRRVFQRGTTSASVPIAGTWTSGTQAIQARIINADTLAEVVTWTTIVNSPTGSTWSGNITVPQGGWYRVEVRRSGLTGTTKRSANRLGVGDIWLFAGQSQQARMSTLVGTPPTAHTLTVYRNSNGLWQAPGEFSGTGGNGGIRFMNLMQQYTGVPQAMAQTSVEGTAITDWEDTDTAFVNAKNRLNAIGTIRGILWHQGGTGINDASLTKASYKSRLAAIKTGFASVGSFSLFGVFPLMHRTDTTNTDAATQQTRQAHYEYIAENAGTVNLGWTPDVPMADDVHQTAAGSEVIAYAYAHALLYTMGIVTEPHLGPRITGVSRNGTVLTLTVLHNGGTSLKTQFGTQQGSIFSDEYSNEFDGMASASGTPTGFQVFPRDSAHNDGAAMAISSIALGTSTITITLSANPGTAVDVYYQYGRFDNTAPVFDNSTALGRTYGNALQPLMAPVQSAVEATAVTNPTLKLNGVDTWIRYSDSSRWDLPDADWTMGVFLKVFSPELSGSQQTSYFFSSGSYGVLNSFNLFFYENGATTANANKVEFIVRGAGASSFIARPDTPDPSVLNAAWRLWVVEFVKATETVNVYYCNVNGSRTLYATVAAPGLGLIAPTTGPALGTRAPPAVNSGLYLNGAFAEFFRLDGRLTASEVEAIASGDDIRVDLGKTTLVHTKFKTLTTPIADETGTGLTAALHGTDLSLVEGPIFREPTASVRFNAVDTKYEFADSPSFNLPNADWTMGVMCATTDNSGTAGQYLFSNGFFMAAMSLNILFWEASSATTPNQVSLAMEGSGLVEIEVTGTAVPTLLSDGVFRLWTFERVKATETINIYYTTVNGSRVLYGTGSSASLGSINPPGGGSGIPTIGTRAITPGSRWYKGDMYMQFQLNSLLTQSQTESIARGLDPITNLNLTPSWYVKTNAITPTISDLSGNGNTATLFGSASVVAGPPFTY
jgi:hypothetical protein